MSGGLAWLAIAMVFVVALVLARLLAHDPWRLFSLSEHQRQPTRLADLLPWALLAGPDVVLNKNGSFLAVFQYRGPDLFSATREELMGVAARVNNALRRLPAGWAIYADDFRMRSRIPPSPVWPDPVTHVLDAERQAFLEEKAHFENEYFLTLVYLPPRDVSRRVRGWFYEGEEEAPHAAPLVAFRQERDRIESLLSGVLPEVRRLEGSALLTYLKRCISPNAHPVNLPETPMYLDALLPDTPLTGGLAPKLGREWIHAITVRAFPGESTPGMLDALNRLPFSYRWVTRFIFEDRLDAERLMKSYQQKWLSLRKSLAVLFREALFGETSVMQNTDAVNKAADVDDALQALGTEAVAFGYFTQTVVLRDHDPKRLAEQALQVERVIQGLGFTTIDENLNHNAFEAFLGAIPGNCAQNVRHPILHTLNLVHLFPLSAVWAGQRGDENLNGEPLLQVVTEGATPFRLSLNVGDVGHTLILGPTGSGKSTLLRALESAWRRYPNAQVYTFDKNKSSLILAKAVGADFYDLGHADCPLAFQPLARIDEEGERAWALEWLLTLAEHEGLALTPAHKSAIWRSLQSLSSAPKDERTLTGFRSLLTDRSLKDLFQPYTHEGSAGRLLDADHDSLPVSAWQVFEMGELIGNRPRAVMPVLTYLFHALERRFRADAPTLLTLDEGWLFLDHPVFAPKLREWLKSLRRFKVYLVFASQSPADVAKSPLYDVIKESCATRLFLPNPNATERESAEGYARFGLNSRQREILRSATPKREYYLSSPLGHRLFSLALSDVGLAYCAATGDEDIRGIAPFLNLPTEAFNRQYLASRHLEWALEVMYGPTAHVA